MLPDSLPDQSSRAELNGLRACLAAVVDQAVELHETHPSLLLTSYRDALEYRLSTTSHAYTVLNAYEAIQKMDRLEAALGEIREIAAREWAADETNYEWYGDIAGVAEQALGLTPSTPLASDETQVRRGCPACRESASGLCSWHRDYGSDSISPSQAATRERQVDD